MSASSHVAGRRLAHAEVSPSTVWPHKAIDEDAWLHAWFSALNQLTFAFTEARRDTPTAHFHVVLTREDAD